MTAPTYTDLTLKGINYSIDQLQSYCEKQLSFQLEAWEVELYEFILQWINKEHFIEVNTSGSTGVPKKIRIEKQKMVNSAVMTCNHFNLQKGNSALLCLPVKYIAGKMMIVRAFIGKLNLLPIPPTASPLNGWKPTIIDFCAMTPMQAQQSLDEPQTANKINAINQIILGGAPVNDQLKQKIHKLESHFYETYGMTETITHIAVKKIDKYNDDWFEILAGIAIEKDERDCLIINAPNLIDAPIITNDVVELKGQRNFKWKGRYDFIINSGGIKVNPEEIEKLITPLVNHRFVISSMKDHLLGEKIVLVIETGQPFEESKKHHLLKLFKDVLKTNHCPKAIVYIPKIPETGFGKLNRKQLKALIN